MLRSRLLGLAPIVLLAGCSGGEGLDEKDSMAGNFNGVKITNNQTSRDSSMPKAEKKDGAAKTDAEKPK